MENRAKQKGKNCLTSTERVHTNIVCIIKNTVYIYGRYNICGSKTFMLRSLSQHWFNQNIFQEVNLFTPHQNIAVTHTGISVFFYIHEI